MNSAETTGIIAVADADVRNSIRKFAGQVPNFRVVAEAGDGKEAHRNQVWMPAPEGGPRGAAPRAKTSRMIMRPPQQGHGGR